MRIKNENYEITKLNEIKKDLRKGRKRKMRKKIRMTGEGERGNGR